MTNKKFIMMRIFSYIRKLLKQFFFSKPKFIFLNTRKSNELFFLVCPPVNFTAHTSLHQNLFSMLETFQVFFSRASHPFFLHRVLCHLSVWCTALIGAPVRRQPETFYSYREFLNLRYSQFIAKNFKCRLVNLAL